jgi:hypothetical protein
MYKFIKLVYPYDVTTCWLLQPHVITHLHDITIMVLHPCWGLDVDVCLFSYR